MLIWTAKFSRKKAVSTVIFMGVVMAALIVLMGRTPEEPEIPLPKLTNNEERVAYLQSLGWEVEPEPIETLQFLLPAELEEPYRSYNELQLSQGFDLTHCCGKQISRCTYTVKNYPDQTDGVQANLYICEDIPVAGDVCSSGANGFQIPLISKEE
ncbi:MAG: DUF4830 domain-containing protein [Oscillibacter sp.]|nr:DUF4830 domain-containing protein [Oscillibacter sp.]